MFPPVFSSKTPIPFRRLHIDASSFTRSVVSGSFPEDSLWCCGYPPAAAWKYLSSCRPLCKRKHDTVTGNTIKHRKYRLSQIKSHRQTLKSDPFCHGRQPVQVTLHPRQFHQNNSPDIPHVQAPRSSMLSPQPCRIPDHDRNCLLQSSAQQHIPSACNRCSVRASISPWILCRNTKYQPHRKTHADAPLPHA